MTSGISLRGHVTHPPPLLPSNAPSNVETMATASRNQFVTHSLHFVWSVRQSSGAAVGENGAQALGASNFLKWGQAVNNHKSLPVWLLSDHLLVNSQRETWKTQTRLCTTTCTTCMPKTVLTNLSGGKKHTHTHPHSPLYHTTSVKHMHIENWNTLTYTFHCIHSQAL